MSKKNGNFSILLRWLHAFHALITLTYSGNTKHLLTCIVYAGASDEVSAINQSLEMRSVTSSSPSESLNLNSADNVQERLCAENMLSSKTATAAAKKSIIKLPAIADGSNTSTTMAAASETLSQEAGSTSTDGDNNKQNDEMNNTDLDDTESMTDDSIEWDQFQSAAPVGVDPQQMFNNGTPDFVDSATETFDNGTPDKVQLAPVPGDPQYPFAVGTSDSSVQSASEPDEDDLPISCHVNDACTPDSTEDTSPAQATE